MIVACNGSCEGNACFQSPTERFPIGCTPGIAKKGLPSYWIIFLLSKNIGKKKSKINTADFRIQGTGIKHDKLQS